VVIVDVLALVSKVIFTPWRIAEVIFPSRDAIASNHLGRILASFYVGHTVMVVMGMRIGKRSHGKPIFTFSGRVIGLKRISVLA
jgi:hypothetical protein